MPAAADAEARELVTEGGYFIAPAPASQAGTNAPKPITKIPHNRKHLGMYHLIPQLCHSGTTQEGPTTESFRGM